MIKEKVDTKSNLAILRGLTERLGGIQSTAIKADKARAVADDKREGRDVERKVIYEEFTQALSVYKVISENVIKKIDDFIAVLSKTGKK